MKRISILFLQVVTALIGLVALALLVRLPLTEGRAKNLDLLHIYSDPFILYGYAASIPFFVALYKVFTLLGYSRQNKLFSQDAVRKLQSIKYCAIILSGLIVMAGLYIKLFHDKADDPAGFLALCIVTTFFSLVIAATAARAGKSLQNAIARKSKNDVPL